MKLYHIMRSSSDLKTNKTEISDEYKQKQKRTNIIVFEKLHMYKKNCVLMRSYNLTKTQKQTCTVFKIIS